MLQNLKVDLIYYLSATDFEMEFNLCGCCRMRLLSDKVNNQNEYVKSLARAVGRSKIVISCGPLFGEKGLIKTASVATKIPTEIVDNSLYHIETNQNITILSGAVPLVTNDKIFGGCILERDGQTMIFLTESKSVRKKILKELLHDYIYQVSVMPENADIGAHEEKKEEKAEKEETKEPQNLETAAPTVDIPVASELLSEPVKVSKAVENETPVNIKLTAKEIKKQIRSILDQTEDSKEKTELLNTIVLDEESLQDERFNETVDSDDTEDFFDLQEDEKLEEPEETDELEETEEFEETESFSEENNTEDIDDIDSFYFVDDESNDTADEEVFLYDNDENSEYINIEEGASKPISVSRQNKSYVKGTEAFEKTLIKPNKTVKIWLIVLLCLLSLTVLALAYFVVVNPLINGVSIMENLKNLLTPANIT